jgi:hypothetical protein
LVTYADAFAGVFVTVFQCRPVQGAWNFTLETVCVDYVSYLYASSAVNVATDILLCALPLPHIWRLNMPKRQRIILCVLLAGGARCVCTACHRTMLTFGSACLVGIVRIAYLHHLRVLDVTCKCTLNSRFISEDSRIQHAKRHSSRRRASKSASSRVIPLSYNS